MASTSDIKRGMCIVHNNDIFIIVEFQHVKPGKGPITNIIVERFTVLGKEQYKDADVGNAPIIDWVSIVCASATPGRVLHVQFNSLRQFCTCLKALAPGWA